METQHPEEPVEMSSCVAYGHAKNVEPHHPEQPIEMSRCVAYGHVKDMETHHPEEHGKDDL